MDKIVEKELKYQEKCRKIGIGVCVAILALFVAGIMFCLTYIQKPSEIDRQMHQLERTIVLNNGITFVIKPSYKDDKLRINLNVSKGWARLNDDECYDVHLVDSDGFDIISIPFHEGDFVWERNDDHNAYKQITISPASKLKKGVKFKMRYPAWVEDM